MEKTLKEILKYLLPLLVFLVPGIVGFFVSSRIENIKENYRKCYTRCILIEYLNLSEKWMLGKLSKDDAVRYWQKATSNCDEECSNEISDISEKLSLAAIIVTLCLIFYLILKLNEYFKLEE
ncbi:MAG: hypothetical protein ACO2PO_09940 [Candidatus Calescibacterium sp.]|jgi:uncharacterized protein YneF (UPF0154 family)